jgi:alpha-L-rhamnosidase
MSCFHRNPSGNWPFWGCAFTLPDGRCSIRSIKLTEPQQARESTAKAVLTRLGRLWRTTRLAALGLLLGAAAAPAFAAAPFAPTNLLVDDVANPVGTEAVPYFGWLDNDTNANEIQSAYEVLVASSMNNLNTNYGDVWDSGEVASSRENHVVYAGPTNLTADTEYYWKVRTWDREGIASPYSTNATFTVGLLTNSDWSSASWIEGTNGAADNYTYYRKWTAALPATTVQRATAYVTSVHKYALYVNGTLVGKGPAYAFPQYQFYNAFDITGLVTNGTTNLFAIFNHYFGGGSGRVASLPGVLMQVNIHFSDGTSTNIGTDGTWFQSQATNWVTGQSLRNGEGAGYIEKIFAGPLTTNWFTTGFDASAWGAPTVIGGQPNSTWPGPLLPDLTRIVETVLTPVSVTMDQSGSAYVVDMGKVYSGVPLITFIGGAFGLTINMGGGFALLPSGDIDPSQNQSTTLTYYAVLDGMPFTYQPAEYDTMRYFAITNPPMPITTNSFAFVERNSQMNDASSCFTSSNATLNAVWGLMKHTLPVDAQEEFIDSMRQKGGFLGDGFQESLAAMSVEDERPLTRRRLNEFIESMTEFWSTPAANVGRVNACYPDDSNARDIPDYTQMYLDWVWEYYMQTGDIAFLGTNYTALTNIAQYLNRDLNPDDGLVTKLLGGTSSSYTNGIIDWPPDMQFGYDLNTVRDPGNAATVINGWAWEDYDIVSRIAGELGNTTDSNTYRALATNLQAAINTNLLNSSGLYVDGLEPDGTQSTHTSQHANAFPLSLNLVPPAQQAGVAALVVSNNMSVSALGILQLVRALGEANQGPALLNLYTNATNYGWAQILSLGGTATWESWTANTDGNSESHGWGAVGLDGYVRYILGVKPLTAQFGQVQIMPLDFGTNLASASGTLTTDRGAISVEWDRSTTLYHLAVTIPVNVTANVYVPQVGFGNTILNVDGTNVTGMVTNLAGTANGYLGVSGLGSGTHNFERPLEAPPTSLAAIPGSTQIFLSWPPPPGATNYIIQRGSSSGNETTTVASNVTGTNYTDTGLTNGDTYYYVVVAVGPIGYSTGSPEASASPILGVPGIYWINTLTSSSQDWNFNANWNTGTSFPNSARALAIINNNITAKQTIALNQSITVGLLDIGAPGGSYNIAANGGALTLDNSNAPASLLEVTNSSGDTISAFITNNGSLVITNFSTNTFTLSGNISGATNGITVNGSLTLSGTNTYTGGLVIDTNSIVLTGNTNASLVAWGSGDITFMGGTLQFFGYAGSSAADWGGCFNTFNIPAGQAGTLLLPPVFGNTTLFASALTGGGILNVTVDYIRDSFAGNWSAFNGQINVSPRSGSGDFRINNTDGYANAAIYLDSGVNFYNVNNNLQTISIGELGGASGAYIGAGSSASLNPTWRIGARNTTNTYAGVIADSGVTSLIKVGTGTLVLSGPNTYSGGTTVSAGLLLVNNTTGSGTGAGAVTVASGATLGGAGAVAGPVTVNSGGTLAPGNPMGALIFSNSLTLAAGSTTILAVSQAPLTNAAAVVLGGLANGGALVVTNLGATPLKGGDTFTLFSANNYSGTFASVMLPALHPALAWNTNLLNTAGEVSVVITTQPLLKPLAVSSRGLIFAGSGGVASAKYYLVGSSNIATPLSNWVPVLTNLFDASGDFDFTNPPVPGQPQEFYMLELP